MGFNGVLYGYSPIYDTANGKPNFEETRVSLRALNLRRELYAQRQLVSNWFERGRGKLRRPLLIQV